MLSVSEEKVIYAAEYVRMSTEHQKYSQDNQSAYIHEYAVRHNIIIKHSYSDSGKSGLNLSGRAGLQSLLNDVMNHKISISVLLVYDVSRFGRFQDTDEAGHYCHLIQQNGVRIIYCAEPFSDDNQEMKMLGLAFSRYGAASYSRNLSEKVFLGQANLIRKGFHQGGMPGYGLRRMLIDENRVEKGELKFGQRKSIQTDRVILVPGPDNEVHIVNKIFDMFNIEAKPERVIASELNRNNITAENGTEWTRGKIHHILTNEKYIGNNVYNKTSFKLKQKHVINPEDEWIRYDGAYEPIVSVEKFNLAREIIKDRSIIFSEDELLGKLHSLLMKKGRLSGLLIDEEELLPSSSVYRARFGSLLKVYRLVGYNPKSDYSWLDTRKYLQGINQKMSDKLIENIYLSDGWVSDAHDNGLLNVNDEFTILIQTIRCQKKQSGGLRWKIKFHHTIAPDVSIAARMDSLNTTVIDYYIFPSIDSLLNNKELKEQNHFTLDMYRFEDLHPLYRLVKRAKLKEMNDEPE